MLSKIWAKSWLLVAYSCIINSWRLSEFVGFCWSTHLMRIDYKFSKVWRVSWPWTQHFYILFPEPLSYHCIMLEKSLFITKLLLDGWESCSQRMFCIFWIFITTFWSICITAIIKPEAADFYIRMNICVILKAFGHDCKYWKCKKKSTVFVSLPPIFVCLWELVWTKSQNQSHKVAVYTEKGCQNGTTQKTTNSNRQCFD